MTFSQKVKNEVNSSKLKCDDCRFAMIYGIVLFSRGLTPEKMVFSIENKNIVDFFAEGIVEYTSAIVSLRSPNIKNIQSRPIYSLSIDDSLDRQSVIDTFLNYEGSEKGTINRDFLKKDCCKSAFIKGVFIACGSVSDPQKEYHLDFNIAEKQLAVNLLYFMDEVGLGFKLTNKSKGYSLYTKESVQIENTLTYIGAVKATMELINLKIEKDIRNNVNRVTNCETANIAKTVNAAQEQIKKIKLLEEEIGLENLPAELQEIALMRLINPEATLSELCKLNGNKISRSGLNHRLSKLCKLADDLSKE